MSHTKGLTGCIWSFGLFVGSYGPFFRPEGSFLIGPSCRPNGLLNIRMVIYGAYWGRARTFWPYGLFLRLFKLLLYRKCNIGSLWMVFVSVGVV